PISTSNPALNRVLNQKRRLVILTKSDLAEPGQNEKWVKHLESEGHVVLLLDVLKDPVKKLILEKTEIVMKEKWERDKRRGIRPRP
ncbi:ribosome biogenesis GTPase YlqF, partial [Roseburia faecis]|nr:ribosome biogenesis GTPase YlqF [Roseburia faecis]